MATIGRMTNEEARAYLERLRWPNGTICPHCGTVGESTLLVSKPGSKTRPGVWKCKPCRKQFTVTVGTVMERSHIELSIWMQTFFLLCSAKKSMSALQLQRQLGIGSYKTAWFLAHRVRFAMASVPLGQIMKGIIEADETYVGGKPRKRPWRGSESRERNNNVGRGTLKQPVAVVLERGGAARSKMVQAPEAKFLRRLIYDSVDRAQSSLRTDELGAYRTIGKTFAGGHEAVQHSKYEFARPGAIHSNTAESYFSLFKRGFHGSFHHLSIRHMQRYLDEFSFRWSHKTVSDADRTDIALRQADGVRLMYRPPKGWTGPRPA